MRRAIAITLTLFFGWMVCAPLFVDAAEANLPACCRRAGKHHCGMDSSFDGSSQRTVAQVAPRCPEFPNSTAATYPVTGPVPAVGSPATAIFEHPAAIPQTEARYRTSFARSRQKRGPPPVIA